MLYVDFAESSKNNQQDAIQSAYFGKQCFRIFTACCYTESHHNDNVRNDNVIVITESSDHDRVAKRCPENRAYSRVPRGWNNMGGRGGGGGLRVGG